MRKVAHVTPSILPRRLGACLVIPHARGYYFVYRRHNDSCVATCGCMAIHQYTVPQAGGSLKFNFRSFLMFPILADFTYIKMMAVCLIDHINQIRQHDRECPIAVGPIKSEMTKIIAARLAFELSDGSIAMCLDAFNSFNSASLVTHPVGLHNDTFRGRSESIENKMLITVQDYGIIGRGGNRFKATRNDQKVVANFGLGWWKKTRKKLCLSEY